MSNVQRTQYLAEGVVLNIHGEKFDGMVCEAACELNGRFVISWQCIDEFTAKLGSLIDQYRL